MMEQLREVTLALGCIERQGDDGRGEGVERTEGPSADKTKSRDSAVVFCAVGQRLESFPLVLSGV